MSKYPDNLHEHVPRDPTQEELPKCELCGEPMPPGETMFKYHGYSGPCPKPPLPQKDDLLLRGQSIWQRLDPAIEDPVGTGLASKWIAEALSCIATLKAENERAKQELAAYIADGLPEYQRLGKELRDRMEAAQSQAAAMAGLLEAALADARDKARTADAREGIKHESWCSTLQECDCGAAIAAIQREGEK